MRLTPPVRSRRRGDLEIGEHTPNACEEGQRSGEDVAERELDHSWKFWGWETSAGGGQNRRGGRVRCLRRLAAKCADNEASEAWQSPASGKESPN